MMRRGAASRGIGSVLPRRPLAEVTDNAENNSGYTDQVVLRSKMAGAPRVVMSPVPSPAGAAASPMPEDAGPTSPSKTGITRNLSELSSHVMQLKAETARLTAQAVNGTPSKSAMRPDAGTFELRVENDALRRQVKEARSNAATLNAKLAKMESERTMLERECGIERDLVTKLRAEAAQMQTDFDYWANNLKTENKRLAKEKTAAIELANKISRAQGEISLLKTTLESRLQSALAENKRLLDEKHAQRRHAVEASAVLEQQLRAALLDKTAAQSRADRLERELRAVRDARSCATSGSPMAAASPGPVWSTAEADGISAPAADSVESIAAEQPTAGKVSSIRARFETIGLSHAASTASRIPRRASSSKTSTPSRRRQRSLVISSPSRSVRSLISAFAGSSTSRSQSATARTTEATAVAAAAAATALALASAGAATPPTTPPRSDRARSSASRASGVSKAFSSPSLRPGAVSRVRSALDARVNDNTPIPFTSPSLRRGAVASARQALGVVNSPQQEEEVSRKTQPQQQQAGFASPSIPPRGTVASLRISLGQHPSLAARAGDDDLPAPVLDDDEDEVVAQTMSDEAVAAAVAATKAGMERVLLQADQAVQSIIAETDDVVLKLMLDNAAVSDAVGASVAVDMAMDCVASDSIASIPDTAVLDHVLDEVLAAAAVLDDVARLDMGEDMDEDNNSQLDLLTSAAADDDDDDYELPFDLRFPGAEVPPVRLGSASSSMLVHCRIIDAGAEYVQQHDDDDDDDDTDDDMAVSDAADLQHVLGAESDTVHNVDDDIARVDDASGISDTGDDNEQLSFDLQYPGGDVAQLALDAPSTSVLLHPRIVDVDADGVVVPLGDEKQSKKTRSRRKQSRKHTPIARISTSRVSLLPAPTMPALPAPRLVPVVATVPKLIPVASAVAAPATQPSDDADAAVKKPSKSFLRRQRRKLLRQAIAEGRGPASIAAGAEPSPIIVPDTQLPAPQTPACEMEDDAAELPPATPLRTPSRPLTAAGANSLTTPCTSSTPVTMVATPVPVPATTPGFVSPRRPRHRVSPLALKAARIFVNWHHGSAVAAPRPQLGVQPLRLIAAAAVLRREKIRATPALHPHPLDASRATKKKRRRILVHARRTPPLKMRLQTSPVTSRTKPQPSGQQQRADSELNPRAPEFVPKQYASMLRRTSPKLIRSSGSSNSSLVRAVSQAVSHAVVPRIGHECRMRCCKKQHQGLAA